MRIYDLISSLFFLVCGIFITVNSLRLPVGTFQRPDSGLLPLLVGVLLSIFSAALLVGSLLRVSSGQKKPFWGQERQGYKTVITVLALLAYAVTFEWLGFLLSTFLLTATLFRPIGGLGGRAPWAAQP